MNLVLFTSLSPFRSPTPRLAAEQITCGPGLEEVTVGNRKLTLRTPGGNFDAGTVLRRLSRQQQPDAVTVLVDGHSASWPRGLAGLAAPKILLLAEAPRTPEFTAQLADYLRREPFDRVIVGSDRRDAVRLLEAGIKNLAWLPGWLFARSDAEVTAARSRQRSPHIAVAGRIGASELGLLRSAGALAKHGLAVLPRLVAESEVLFHFGSASLALVDDREEGFDRRLFQALAAGTAALCPSPDPACGWDALWPDGPPLAAFASSQQLLERAKHFLARPREARALGDKAAAWFDARFHARHRQEVFSALIFDNRVQPEFVLAASPSTAGGGPAVAAALPPAAVPVPPADAAGNKARALLDAGDKPKALELALATLKANEASWPSALVLAELALEGGKADLFQRMLAQVRRHAPDDEQLARLELASVGFLTEWRATALLARAWQAWESGQGLAATVLANQSLQKDGSSADAFAVAGQAGFATARQGRQWEQYGKMLNILQLAAETNPRRADLWRQLAVARRLAGGAVLPDAITAYRLALQIDPERPEDWFGLGEAHLALGDAAAAVEALGEAAQRAPQSLNVADWLGHAHKRQGHLLEAQACHRQAWGGAAASARATVTERPERRRVVFVLQNGHGWSCWSSLYAEFAADPSWEAIVVGLPWLHPSFQNSSQKDQDKIFDFLAENQIPHRRWTEFLLAENSADLVFLQNPYDSTRPEGWKVPDLIAAGHRLAYVPYGIEIGSSAEALEYQFDMRLHRYAWAVFARSEAHRALFGQHCLTGSRHVQVTGHPKFDDIGRGDRVQPDPELLAFAQGRPLVLWNPHFDARLNGTRFGDGFSTFFRWRNFLLAEIGRRPDLAFVIRPHPNFFSVLEERGLLTAAQHAQFLQQCAAAGIFVHRSPAYFPMLAAVDAIISDGSSLLIEFGISGKPVCYLHNPDGPMGHLSYELDFEFVRQHCAWATEESQIQAFLDDLPAASADQAARTRRAAELHRRMGVTEETAAARIKRVIESQFAAEEARSGADPTYSSPAGVEEAGSKQLSSGRRNVSPSTAR